jgi:HEAT repeat protein
MDSKYNKSDIRKLKEKKDVEGLIKALKYEDSSIRVFSAGALGEIGDERAVTPLTRSLKDEEEEVQNEALNALFKIGDPAVNTLIMALEDEKLAAGAKLALIKIGEPASRNLIFKYNNQNRNTQISYIDIMGEIGDKNSVEHLIHILEVIKSRETYDRDILISTVKAIGKIGDENSKDIIHDLYFRFCSSQSDKYLTEIFLDVITCVDIEGSDFLVQELTNNNPFVKVIVEETLMGMEHQIALDPLIQALKDKNGDIRKRAAEILCRIGEPAVMPLIQVLEDEDRYIRYGSAESLGIIGDERAVKPLIHTLKDKDSYVRLEAAGALDSMGWKSVGGEDCAYYLIAKAEWKDVIGMGKPAVLPLIQTLKEGESDLRYEAAEALGEIGDKRALEPLNHSLKYDKEDIRVKAAEVLAKMG